MNSKRKESDSMGQIDVPKEALYGAQTARSLIHFHIGDDLMPVDLIKQYVFLKKACALTNWKLKKLSKAKKDLIVFACDQLLKKHHTEAFPLFVYQTGSGTQNNMNVNEVIANIANKKAGKAFGSNTPIHPNDDVNMSQSTNDSFPSVMHMTACHLVIEKLIPSLKNLIKALKDKEKKFHTVIKIGRTHLMDAVPLTLGQEFSGYRAQMEDNLARIEQAVNELYYLPLGGSAVGTGINTPKNFASQVVRQISLLTKMKYKPASNRFSQMAAHDRLVHLSASLKTLSASLMKMSHDLAWMGSGPRCGLGELILPENEPGSSIMPGKVNPTQCEALCMVAAQVYGYDTAIAIAGALGNFELNVYKPLIIFNLTKSLLILSDSMEAFTNYFLIPIKANLPKITQHLEDSLMLVTALSPHIGYEKASEIAHYAFIHQLSLKEASIKLNYLSEKEFDSLVDVRKMIRF